MAIASANRVSLGENSRFLIEGIILRVREGEVVEDPEKLDATDNGSGGCREQSRGPFGLSITADCFFRATDNRFRIAPIFIAGEEFFFGNGFQIYPDIINAPNCFYNLPIIYVEKISMKIAGTGNISYSMMINNQGAFTRSP